MRVAIDLLVAEKEPGDALLATRALLAGLLRVDQTNEYIIITGRPKEYQALARMPNMRIHLVKLRSWRGIMIKHQLLLPDVLRQLQPDVLHVPAFAAPIGWHGPLVITVHDLAFLKAPDQPSIYVRLYWQYLLRESVRRAERIITFNEQTRDELVFHLALEPERIRVIHQPQHLSLGLTDISAGNIEELQFSSELYVCASSTHQVYQEALNTDSSPVLIKASANGSSQNAMLEETHPDVSVIVPASRLQKASQALERLSHQHYAGKIEIIVVGPPANELALHWPILPVNPGPIREPGKARNLGATYATGDVLLFLDDDMLVTEDWVEQNVYALQQPNVGAVGARMPGKSKSFFARCVDFANCGYYQHGHTMDGPVGSGSMGVLRSVFLTAEGFDENLRSGEDMDLCYRIQKQGYRTVYQPHILVIHDHHQDTFRKLLRYNYAHGLAGGLTTKIRHRDIGLKNRLLSSVHSPPIFLMLLPCIAIAATAGIVAVNVPENWVVLLYAPFIFIAKLAYEFGVFRRLALPKAKTEGFSGESFPTQAS